jgi:hypothetical protein
VHPAATARAACVHAARARAGRAVRVGRARAVAGSAATARAACVHAARARAARAVRVGPARAVAGSAATARAARVRAAPARAGRAVRDVTVLAATARAARVRAAPARAVRVGPVRVAVPPAAVARASAAGRAVVVWLAVRVPVQAPAVAVRSGGPEQIAVARPQGVALAAASAELAAATGDPMTTVAAASARTVPRLTARAVDQAVAAARPAVSAGLRALAADPVRVGPSTRQAAPRGGLAALAAHRGRNAGGMAAETRQPSGHRVEPLVTAGMAVTAAATAERLGVPTIGSGGAKPSRGAAMVTTAVTMAGAAMVATAVTMAGAAMVATAVTRDGAAIAPARGGLTTAVAAGTHRRAADQAAPAARLPGCTGMPAVRRAGCPERRTQPGSVGVPAPAAVFFRQAMTHAAATASLGFAGSLRKRGWTSPTASWPGSWIRRPWRSCGHCPVIWPR